MAAKTVNSLLRKAYQDFSGGLNDHDSNIVIRQNEFSQLENFVVNDSGLLEKCNGFIKDGAPFTDATTNFISMLAPYKTGATVDKLIMAAVDTANSHANYKVDLKETSGDSSYSYIGHTTGTADFTNGSATVTGTGTAWTSHLKVGDKIKASSHADSVYGTISVIGSDTSITLSSTYTGATTGGAVAYKARVMFHKDFILQAKQFNNKLVMTNGSEVLATYNNTTVDKVTDAQAPVAQFIETHKSRIFLARTSALPSSIFWSAVNDETSWDAAATEPVFPQDGGNICAIKSFADSLVVFKDNGYIYQVMGSFDQDATGEPAFIRKIDTPENMGVVAGQTVVTHDDGSLYFLTQTGVYSIDRRMELKKVSWNIQGSVEDTDLQVGTTASKTHIWDSAAQFNAGTLSGTRVTTDNILESIFDTYAIGTANKKADCCSVAIDSANTVHVAYVDSASTNVIKYMSWTSAGVITTETAYTHTTSRAIEKLSLAIYSTTAVGIVFYIESTEDVDLWFVERTSGTWGSATNMPDASGGMPFKSVCVQYNSSGDPRVGALATYTDGTVFSLLYYRRSGATWSLTTLDNGHTSTTGRSLHMALDASDRPRFASLNNATTVTYASCDADGTNYAESDLSVTSIPAFSRSSVAFNSISDILFAFTDNGAIKRRNHTASTTTTIDSSGDRMLWYTNSSNKQAWLQVSSTGTETFRYETSYTGGTAEFTNGSTAVVGTSTRWLGYVAVGDTIKVTSHADSVYATVLTVNSDTSITLSANYSGASTGGAVAYVAKSLKSVANPATTPCDTTYLPGSNCGVTNGTVYAFLQFGASANEILVRRIAPDAFWTGDEKSDATLTSWGTYDIGSLTANGNTITNFIALNTASPATTYNTIISGATISTDATKIYAIPRIRIVLAAWAKSTVDSFTMNYLGAGIDARRAIAIVFDNELYIAHTEAGASANNYVFLMDKERRWSKLTHPVSAMARYRNRLYAGNSGTSDLNILMETKLFNTTAYTATAVTKQDFLGSLELEKSLYKVYLLYKQQELGSFTFSYRLDEFADTDSGWVDTAVDQTVAGLYEIPIKEGKCKTIQFKAVNSGSSNSCEIIGWVILYGYLHTR